MADIFISYSREDKDRIEPILKGLRSLSISVWHDLSIETGTQFDEEIEKQLVAAQAILVCWSQFSVKSQYVKGEAKRGFDQGKLIPCLLEPCKLPVFFEFSQAEDISGWNGATDHPGWRKIIDRVSIILKRPGLPHLLDARATKDVQQLILWAQTFQDDPHAIELWASLEKRERERFNEEMRTTRDAISVLVKSRDDDLRVRVADCVKAFEAWIADIKKMPYDARPNPTALLTRMESQMAVAMPQLEAERDAANERARSLEAAHNAAVAENTRLKKQSTTPLLRWGMMLAGIMVGATAGLGGYRAFFDRASTGVELDAANTELRSITDERNKQKQAIDQAASAQQELETKLSDMQQRLAAVSSSATKVVDLQSALTAKNTQIVELTAELTSAKGKLAQDANIEAEREHALANARDELAAARKRITDLEREAQNSQSVLTRLAEEVRRTNVASPKLADKGAGTSDNQNPIPNEMAIELPSAKNVDYKRFENRDLDGNPIRELPTTDIQKCEAACQQNKDCRGYSFNKWSNLCFLKANFNVLKINPRSVSGIRKDMPAPPTANFAMERYRGKAFPTSGYKTFKVKQFETCEKSCQNENACVAFTFMKPPDGTCHLFDTTGEYFPNAAADSGGKL